MGLQVANKPIRAVLLGFNSGLAFVQETRIEQTNNARMGGVIARLVC